MSNEQESLILDRREVVAGFGGAGLAYTLFVRAGDAPPSAEPSAGSSTGPAKSVAPSRSPRITNAARFAGEPNLALVDLDADVFIAGAGMAGICAALAAARHGARVVLVQDRSRLGGNASSEVRMHIVGADHHGGRSGWREGGILEELRLENAARNPEGIWEQWDLLLYEKLAAEENLTLLLDTTLTAAEVEEGSIVRVLARSDRKETIYRIRAKQFGDCTGDARLALEAGAEMRRGREARDEFDESLASETANAETMGSSILFTARDCGKPMPFVAPSWARKIEKRHLRFRGVGSWEYGYWWIEWGGEVDTIRDDERIRRELLAIVLGVWDYIKNSGEHPSSESWTLSWLGMIPGRRESRRIVGDVLLTQHDVEGKGREFPDAVAIGGWPLDDHPSTGFDDPDVPPYHSVPIEQVYSIPLGALHSRSVSNLFMAGRDISATHVAFSSTRVMGTCAVEGQAVGTAAAICARDGITLRELRADEPALAAYRQTLLRDDQTILDLGNRDPHDLARRARITTSGEVPGSRAVHVIDGFVRDAPSRWDHRWGGEMGEEGAWIELSWDEPIPLRRLQITFDSGFHRELTLTAHAGARSRQQWGPQPETVRDYTLAIRRGPAAPLTELATITGNHQRLCRHDFDEEGVDALRLTIHATHGSPEARVFEIRAYS